MRALRLCGSAVILLTLAAPALAKDSPIEYLDILSPEVVGEFGSRDYDLRETFSKNDTRFVGTQSLGGGLELAGGLGLRLCLRFPPGVRVSLEGSVAAGRFYGANGPFDSYSTITRGEFLTGLGYELTVGKILTLHTATMVGLDIDSLDAAGYRAAGAALASTAPDGTPPPGWSLEAISFRLGQQVGLHLQVAKPVAVYADATFDYDGQWRVRAGVSIGAPQSVERGVAPRRF
jgi:hypothetical protein